MGELHWPWDLARDLMPRAEQLSLEIIQLSSHVLFKNHEL